MTWTLPRPVPVGASPEVLSHHADQHPCPLDAAPVVRICPCGSTHALCCPHCERIVFACARRGTPMCDHLAELLEEVPA